VLLALWLCAGCAFVHRYDAQCDRVFDADTGEPIEGAAVVGLYHTVSDSVGRGVRQWAATQETVTDANGEFCLPATTIFEPRLPLSWFDDYVAIWVFKPSYTLINGSRAQANTFTRRATPIGTLVDYKQETDNNRGKTPRNRIFQYSEKRSNHNGMSK